MVVKSLGNVAGCRIDKRGSSRRCRVVLEALSAEAPSGTGSSWSSCLNLELPPVDAQPPPVNSPRSGMVSATYGRSEMRDSCRRGKTVVESQQEAGEKGNLRRDHIPCAVLLGGQRKSPATEREGLISHTLPEMPTFFVRLDMLTGGRDHWC